MVSPLDLLLMAESEAAALLTVECSLLFNCLLLSMRAKQLVVYQVLNVKLERWLKFEVTTEADKPFRIYIMTPRPVSLFSEKPFLVYIMTPPPVYLPFSFSWHEPRKAVDVCAEAHHICMPADDGDVVIIDRGGCRRSINCGGDPNGPIRDPTGPFCYTS